MVTFIHIFVCVLLVLMFIIMLLLCVIFGIDVFLDIKRQFKEIDKIINETKEK